MFIVFRLVRRQTAIMEWKFVFGLDNWGETPYKEINYANNIEYASASHRKPLLLRLIVIGRAFTDPITHARVYIDKVGLRWVASILGHSSFFIQHV